MLDPRVECSSGRSSNSSKERRMRCEHTHTHASSTGPFFEHFERAAGEMQAHAHTRIENARMRGHFPSRKTKKEHVRGLTCLQNNDHRPSEVRELMEKSVGCQSLMLRPILPMSGVRRSYVGRVCLGPSVCLRNGRRILCICVKA